MMSLRSLVAKNEEHYFKVQLLIVYASRTKHQNPPLMLTSNLRSTLSY